jgi:hypothetical protein
MDTGCRYFVDIYRKLQMRKVPCNKTSYVRTDYITFLSSAFSWGLSDYLTFPSWEGGGGSF